MAVTYIGEVKNFHSIGSKNERKYTRKFLLEGEAGDGPFAAEVAFVSATGIKRGTAYSYGSESDAGSFAQTLSSDRDGDDSLNFIVTVEYAPDDTGGETCPWLQPAQIDQQFEQREQGIDYDIWGYPLLNSAYEPFADPVSRQVASRVITVTQNEHYYVPSYEYYVNVVNSNTCTLGGFTYAARTLLIPGIPWQRNYDSQYKAYFWTYRWVFMHRPDTWDKIILDKGFHELVTTTAGKVVRANICPNGVPTSVAAMLNGQGKALDPNDTSYYWFKKQIYPAVPFIFYFRS